MTKWGGTGSPRSCVTWWILPVPLLKPTSSGLVTYTSEGTFSVKVNLFVYFFFRTTGVLSGQGTDGRCWTDAKLTNHVWAHILIPIWTCPFICFRFSCILLFLFYWAWYNLSNVTIWTTWSLILDKMVVIRNTRLKFVLQWPNIDYGGGLRSPNALLVSR